MKILFIGNSYTYYNDMPNIFRNICEENNIDAEVESLTCGGYSIAHYVSDNNEYGIRAKQLLKDNRYDYVVLQEQSVLPAKNPETFFNNVRSFVPYIRENGAVPVLYETWGRPEGAPLLLEYGWTHETMHKMIKDAYEKAAAEIGAVLVPAGDRLSLAYIGGEDTYSDDGGHPSQKGSLIIAETFFETLFGKK